MARWMREELRAARADVLCCSTRHVRPRRYSLLGQCAETAQLTASCHSRSSGPSTNTPALSMESWPSRAPSSSENILFSYASRNLKVAASAGDVVFDSWFRDMEPPVRGSYE